MAGSYSARCLCGAVDISMEGQPQARANCHCSSCRDLYETSMLSATAWLSEQVKVAGDTLATFPHLQKQLSKTFCTRCGETIFGTNRLGMRVIPNSVLARATDGKLAEQLHPTMHLFYRHRIIDVIDDLPKYLDGWDGPTF